MNNKKLLAIIFGTALTLLLFLLQAAFEHNEWRGFWVSGFDIVASAFFLAFLLKE